MSDAVFLALIAAIIVPIMGTAVKWFQDRDIAKRSEANAAAAAVKVEEARKALAASTANVDHKLDNIHTLVNSQLTEAVERFKQALLEIADLKKLLARIAPNDPRVKELTNQSKYVE